MKFSGPVTDVAGEIIEVGQGVQNFKVGDKVVALLSHLVSTQFQSSWYVFLPFYTVSSFTAKK